MHRILKLMFDTAFVLDLSMSLDMEMDARGIHIVVVTYVHAFEILRVECVTLI